MAYRVVGARAIGEDIHDARSWHNRAKCAFELGNIRQAHQDAMRARHESSQFPDQQEPRSASHTTPVSRRRSMAPSNNKSEKLEPVESQEAQELWNACGEPGLKEDPTEWLKARKLPKETKSQKNARKSANVLAENNLHSVSTLLQNGADVNFTQQGLTCLGRAAVAGNVEAVKMLLLHGAELERAAHQRRYKSCGYTPLMLATQQGHVEVMKCLLAAGTYLETSTATTVKGREETVWTVAEQQGTQEVQALLAEVAGPGPATPRPPSTGRPAVATPRAAAAVETARLQSANAALRARALAQSSGQQQQSIDGSPGMSDSVPLAVAMRNDAMRQIVDGGGLSPSHNPPTPSATTIDKHSGRNGGGGGGVLHFPPIPSAQPVQ
jgi:hypothetical protein